jgi:hypothetical protein
MSIPVRNSCIRNVRAGNTVMTNLSLQIQFARSCALKTSGAICRPLTRAFAITALLQRSERSLLSGELAFQMNSFA